MLFHRLLGFALLMVLVTGAAAAPPADYDEMIRTDILVVGATPCGISAAISAARCGSKVILTDMTGHIGGMMSGGLGRTDIGPRNTVGGVFGDFVGNVRRHYVETYGADSQQVKECSKGYFFEPSVAEMIFNRMVKADKKINLKLRYRPESALVYGTRVHGVTFLDLKSNRRIQIRAAVTVDATYEGDIAAMAGVPYRVGRESREEFGEPIAGVLYMDHYTRMVLPGTTGDGDERVQAYNYRLCLTRDPSNRVMPKKPDCYNRDEYRQVLDSIRTGRLQGPMNVLDVRGLPNGKSDTNNTPKSLISTDLPEENYRYPEAGYEERAKIEKRHRDYTLGLLYFLQNDSEMPEDLKSQFRELGFAKDEYTDNDNFPRQLYVREARRIWGLYTFTYHDAVLGPGMLRPPIKYDGIACGGYAMDSHATRKREPGHDDAMEGFYYLGGITRSYQIPYRIMVPQKVDALLVPCGVSATHIGFGTLRMEPVWMAMGQAAGTAAHLARNLFIEPRDVPVGRLQSWLADDGQILTAFSDIQGPDGSVSKEAWQAMQFWGTRGFFDAYDAKPLDQITRGTAAQWLMSAVRQGDFMTWYGPSILHQGGGSSESSLAQLEKLKISDAGDPNAVLTEGEMASWLAKVEPWIDGSIGDNWTKLVGSKDSPPQVTQPSDPDQPVTRARFCEALFARFRSANPAHIP